MLETYIQYLQNTFRENYHVKSFIWSNYAKKGKMKMTFHDIDDFEFEYQYSATTMVRMDNGTISYNEVYNRAKNHLEYEWLSKIKIDNDKEE